MRALFLSVLLLAGGAGILPSAGSTHRLQVRLTPCFDDSPLTFDSLANTNRAGQCLSVTRLDFLLSNIALHRRDGAWLELTNWCTYVCGREGQTSFELNSLPAARFDRIRFHVGVPPGINHRDPAQYPPDHPLNPDVNGLHWGWMGGYVFLALEGRWSPAPESPGKGAAEAGPGSAGGYSFHIANDAHLMTVELPLTLDLNSDCVLCLNLDAARIFNARHPVALSARQNATHSRPDDVLAGRLQDNIEHAFTVASVNPLEMPDTPLPPATPNGSRNLPPGLLVASNATPYPLAISRFFPRPALPEDNPLTEEGVELGRLLFFDRRLSIDNSQSCASCHRPATAFVDAGNAFSRGAEGRDGVRNAMSLANLAWKSSFFWDGRATTLRQQVLLPIQNPVEMHETLTNVVRKLQTLQPAPTAKVANYPEQFARAFGSPEITADRIARALEQFLLTLVSCDSGFDRVLQHRAQFTREEQRGFELFHTEYDPGHRQFGADCFHCHGGPLFQSQTFANNGLDAEPQDLGRFMITGRQADRGKFAVPSLRNVALTAPYMHDGRFSTLEEVVEHYATGVRRSATLDPNLAKHPNGGVPLSAADKRALVAFLKTLTDARFTTPAPDREGTILRSRAEMKE